MEKQILLKFSKSPLFKKLAALDRETDLDSIPEEELRFWFMEAYLKGLLPEEDKKEFQLLLQENPTLRQELVQQDLAGDLLDDFQENDIIQTSEAETDGLIQDELFIKGLLLEKKLPPKKTKYLLPIAYGVAAVFLALLLINYFRPDTESPESLYAKYYTFSQPDNLLSSPTDSEWEMAKKALIERNCGQYLNLINSISHVDSLSSFSAITFFKGMCLMENQSFPEANEAFSLVPESSKRYHQRAQWFGLLALLKRGKIQEAKKSAEAIAETSRHPFREEATYILSNL